MSAIASTTVQRIQALADELFNIGNTTLEKVNEAGKLLSECKKDLPHGQWSSWLEENFSFTDRTARRWMKLHEDMAAGRIKTDTVSGLSEAYKLTTEPRWGTPDKAPSPPPRPSPAAPAPRPSPATVTLEAEIVEPETESIDDESEAVVVDGTKEDILPEIAEKENSWEISRQVIAELKKLDDKISSPLGDVLAYIEKRWKLTFNLKGRK